ncbi:MAG: hypothetical protein K2N05_11990 [Muribaculaceae bacterium]|nr:hypothetical protein [Muribaculaceae bacterium]
MKRLTILAIMAVCMIQTAFSMIPGPPIILECPECGVGKELMSIVSGNTFGASQWSDLYMEAPMLPQLSPVQKCYECGSYFFISQAKSQYDNEKGISDTSDTGRLSFPEMKEALCLLEKDSLSKEDEMAIRFEFLHRYNDLFRFEQRELGQSIHSRSEEDQKLHKENLKGIIALLDPSNDDDLILIAELYRESGDFDKAISILNNYRPSNERQETFLRKLIEKVREKDEKVFLIN